MASQPSSTPIVTRLRCSTPRLIIRASCKFVQLQEVNDFVDVGNLLCTRVLASCRRIAENSSASRIVAVPS